MTVNSRKYFVFLTAIICGFWSQTLYGQLKQRNVLYLHFEQKHIRSDAFPADSVFAVTYRLKCPKPCNFHGYDLRFSYEATKIVPIQGFFAGTASANADIKTANNVSGSHEFRVEVLASTMLDTSNHVLFNYRASVFSTLADSALIAPTLVDVLSETSGIDTVIIDNAPGRDDVSWYPFAVAYLDSVKQSPKNNNLRVSSDSLSMQSDSTATISLYIDSLEQTFVKSGVFKCKIDTSVLTVTDIISTGAFASTTIQKHIVGDSIEIDFTSQTAIQPSGKAFDIVVRARHRTDTVITLLATAQLVILNQDNLVLGVHYTLRPIRVFGLATHDTLNVVNLFPTLAEPSVQTIFSPSGNELTIRFMQPVLQTDKVIQIFEINGGLVYADRTDKESVTLPLRFSNGTYFIAVKDMKSKQVFFTKFFVVR